MSSKPTFKLVYANNNQSNMHGGYSYGANYTSHTNYTNDVPIKNNDTGDETEELYKHKAKKYHYKCQNKLMEMKKASDLKNMEKSWVCPSGFEKYLKPF